jgi:hypothetical protein
MGVGGRHAQTALPLERPGTHCTRRLGEYQSRCGQVQKTSTQQGFDPPTTQPVASRFTD